MFVSGSSAPPGQFGPPVGRGSWIVACGPGEAAHDGRREDRADVVIRHERLGLGAELGGEVDQVVDGHALPLERRRPGGERLRRRVPLAGDVSRRHRPLLDRPDRLARGAVEHEEEALLRRLGERLDGPAVHRDVREDRCARQVPVPDVVVHRLEVPPSLARLDVEGQDAVGKQVVAGPVAAVGVVRGRLCRHVDQAQLLVRRHLAPGARIAGVLARVVEPGVRAELAGRGDGMEDPQAPAGAHVVAAHEALRVAHAAGRHARRVRRAHDDDVGGDDRGGLQADVALDGVDDLVGLALEVDDSAVAESGHRAAGPGVERDKVVARRDEH